jgi:para-aminobenzoate synthetase component 1
MNSLGRRGKPFLFILDFDLREPMVHSLEDFPADGPLYDIRGVRNYSTAPRDAAASEAKRIVGFSKNPVGYAEYRRSFDLVRDHFLNGNTFLTNLTFPTEISINLSLEEIFRLSRARYKLLVPGRFTVFSPESFVTIDDGIISSFPMKGTIDASVPGAQEKILADPKETAEHITIVDLIRNDIGIIADRVRVKRFRYIDYVKTNQKDLLQVSSEITGILPEDYLERLGDIVFAMLPAGSVTGAPKKRTVEIIKEAETYERGFYTGVFGLFDGHRLDSAVMIRFIERTDGGLYFKSGGGLTVYSDPESEYREYVDKVYVPIG